MKEHGQFELWVDNQVLILKASDQWNGETALSFEKQWYTLASSFNKQPWAHIALLDEWQLNTPEVEPIIHKIVAWSIEHNMTHVAQVYSPNLLKQYELDKMVGDKDLPFSKQAFFSIAEAEEWLGKEGFNMDKSLS